MPSWLSCFSNGRAHPNQDLLRDRRYAAASGARLISDDPENVVVELSIADEHLNFHGTTHGGALFSLADCAFSLISNAAGPVAVAIDTHLVVSAATKTGDTLIAEATEVRRGRQLATYQVRVTRDDGRLCGLFTGTVFSQN
ncbi:MAG: hotdog fold thioesterase [Acidimicrobiia bacterium]|nr:hotdog fold thioesterase [Acidimicrobiia bacterium]MDX2467537.1 hotdog fold thioesterase [Acidimicrobiia bacterium]